MKLTEETAFIVKNLEDFKKLQKYCKKFRYRTPDDSYDEYIPYVFYLIPHIRDYQTSDIDWMEDNWQGPVKSIPGISPLKEEYESNFKKMFRLNRIPDELTPEQIERMSNEKVLELWKNQ